MRGGRNPQSPIPEVGDRGPPPPALFCANQRRKLRPFSLWSPLPKSAKVAIGPPKRGDLVILEPKQRTNLQKTPGAMRSDDVEVSLGFSDAGLGREAGAGCSPPPALGRGAPRASEARGVRSGGVAGCLHAVWAMRGGANSVPPILHTRNSHEGIPPKRVLGSETTPVTRTCPETHTPPRAAPRRRTRQGAAIFPRRGRVRRAGGRAGLREFGVFRASRGSPQALDPDPGGAGVFLSGRGVFAAPGPRARRVAARWGCAACATARWNGVPGMRGRANAVSPTSQNCKFP